MKKLILTQLSNRIEHALAQGESARELREIQREIREAKRVEEVERIVRELKLLK